MILCVSLKMSVRPILLKDIRRTAFNNHQQHTGKGNYNRFAPLERNRTFSSGKRQLSASDGAESVSVKSPKLDSNLIFEQLKDQEKRKPCWTRPSSQVRTPLAQPTVG